MDLPNYPEDPELKNIIDKLAQFVARNGIDFERITKEKNQGNPKFEFLSGGQYYRYYQFQLNKERAILRQKSIEQQLSQQPPNLNAINPINSMTPPQMHPPIFAQQPPLGPTPMSQFNSPVHPHANQPPQAFAVALATQQKARNQINELQDQIRQSLDNLNAQHQMLTNQQQMLMDESIRKIQVDELVKLSNDFNINLHEFELLLHPIFETCTKDSISAGKAWISTRCHLPVHHEIICKYFLKRIRSSGMPDIHKLHLLYLINDLFNHCVRKNIDSLKQALTSVVVPIYCLTYVESDGETRQKLMKLEKIWETNNYLDRSIIEQLRNPQISLNNYRQALCNEYGNLLAPITANTMAKFNQLQQQHNDFVNHQNSKIREIQVSTSLPPTSLSMSAVNSSVSGPFLSSTHSPFHQPPVSSVLPMLQPNQMLNTPTALPPAIPSSSISPNVGHTLSQHLAFVQSQGQNIAPPLQPNPHMFNHNNVPANQMPPNANTGPPHHHPPAHLMQHPPPQIPPNVPPPQNVVHSNVVHSNLPPHTSLPPNNHQPPQQPQFTQPDVPYYELPAGLMVPLVKLEDFDYEEINGDDIKLPLPAPPNERLLRAVEEFYAPPSHDKPRNQDGWTQLGLYEFYRAKTQAKKEKDEMEEIERQRKKRQAREDYLIKDMEERSRSKSKSNSPGRVKYSSESSRRSSRSNSKQSSKRGRRSRQKRQKRSYSSSSSSTDSSDFYSNKKYSSDSRSRSRSSSRGRSYKSSRSSSKRYRSHSRSNSPRNRSPDRSRMKFGDFKRHK